MIATFLGLAEPKKYTSHCFRKTAATIFADSGCSIIQLKNAGGWRSDSIAQSYVSESMLSKKSTAQAFQTIASTTSSNINQITNTAATIPSEIPSITTNDFSIHTTLSLHNVGSIENVNIIVAPAREVQPEKLMIRIPAKRKFADAESLIFPTYRYW